MSSENGNGNGDTIDLANAEAVVEVPIVPPNATRAEIAEVQATLPRPEFAPDPRFKFVHFLVTPVVVEVDEQGEPIRNETHTLTAETVLSVPLLKRYAANAEAELENWTARERAAREELRDRLAELHPPDLPANRAGTRAAAKRRKSSAAARKKSSAARRKPRK